jgi:hypothetical protein
MVLILKQYPVCTTKRAADIWCVAYNPLFTFRLLTEVGLLESVRFSLHGISGAHQVVYTLLG